MIKITDNISIGGALDEQQGVLTEFGAILNVAQDLHGTRGWKEIEYAQVGLIDGPGNPPSAYISAVLMLHTLLCRHKRVLVLCHGMRRSIVVVLIYLILKKGRTSDNPSLTFTNWTTWDTVLSELNLPSPIPIHPAHREVFDALPLSLMEMMI